MGVASWRTRKIRERRAMMAARMRLERVLAALGERGVTDEAIGYVARVPTPAVMSWRVGVAFPSPDRLARILALATELGIDTREVS